MTDESKSTGTADSDNGAGVGTPPPALQEQHRQDALALAEQLREARIKGQRSLFIHVLLMFLVAIAVFVVGTYFFVIPRIIRTNLDASLAGQKARNLSARVANIERALVTADSDVADPAVPDSIPAPVDGPADVVVAPGKAEPTKDEPAKPEPAKPEPAKPEPAKDGPAKADPGK